MEQNALNKYPELIILDFCDDQRYDYLDEYDNQIIACRYEVTDSYYGQCLVQPVIVKQWGYEEFDQYLTQWYSEFCEREDAVGSYLGSLGLI